MAQQLIEDIGAILATTFQGEEVVAPVFYKSQVLLAAGGATKAGRVLVYLVVRVELQEGFMAAVHTQAVGWSPSACSPSPAALLAPPPSAPVQTKPNCLYLFVGSDDAGGEFKQAGEEILPCSHCQEDRSSCSRQEGPGSECSHE